MKSLYLDTNIFLNVLLKEEDFVNPSFQLLQDIEEQKHEAFTSFLTLMEMHRILQKQNIEDTEIEKAIQKISSSAVEIILIESTDLFSAYELLKTLRIDPADSIHLAIAQEKRAIFVTRDSELTKKIKTVINTAIPETLI